MSAANERLEDILRRWRGGGLNVEAAIAVRDYDKCRRAESEAKAAFADLVELLEEDGALDVLKARRADVLECVELWRRNVEAMPGWLEETKSELDDVRRRMSARRKIGGVYGGNALDSRRSGIRVKIKAR